MVLEVAQVVLESSSHLGRCLVRRKREFLFEESDGGAKGVVLGVCLWLESL